MKRMIAMVLAVLMVVTLAACSNKVKDIDGVLTGYVQVAEYVGPLAVIEDNGKTFYLATSVLKFAGEAEQADDSLLEAIQNGEIIDIKVSIDGAEKGKTIEIDGKKVPNCLNRRSTFFAIERGGCNISYSADSNETSTHIYLYYNQLYAGV